MTNQNTRHATSAVYVPKTGDNVDAVLYAEYELVVRRSGTKWTQCTRGTDNSLVNTEDALVMRRPESNGVLHYSAALVGLGDTIAGGGIVV